MIIIIPSPDFGSLMHRKSWRTHSIENTFYISDAPQKLENKTSRQGCDRRRGDTL